MLLQVEQTLHLLPLECHLIMPTIRSHGNHPTRAMPSASGGIGRRAAARKLSLRTAAHHRLRRNLASEPSLVIERPRSRPPARAQRSSRTRMLSMDLLRILLAILLPPLGVFLQVGFGLHFWVNILLTLLGYIPGIIHAVWIIARR